MESDNIYSSIYCECVHGKWRREEDERSPQERGVAPRLLLHHFACNNTGYRRTDRLMEADKRTCSYKGRGRGRCSEKMTTMSQLADDSIPYHICEEHQMLVLKGIMPKLCDFISSTEPCYGELAEQSYDWAATALLCEGHRQSFYGSYKKPATHECSGSPCRLCLR